MKQRTLMSIVAAGILAACGALAASASYSSNSGSYNDPAVSLSTGTETSVVPSTSTPGPVPGNPSAPGNRNPSNPNPSSPEQGDRDGHPTHP